MLIAVFPVLRRVTPGKHEVPPPSVATAIAAGVGQTPPRAGAQPSTSGLPPTPPLAPPLSATNTPPLIAALQSPSDPTTHLPTLASRDESLKGSDGIRRVRLVKADSKYPHWRVEETFLRETATGQLRLQNRQVAVADHALVQLQEAAPPDAIEDIARRHGLVLRKTSAKSGLYLLASPQVDIDTLPDLLNALTHEPLVRCAEPDSIVSALATLPNDPSFGQLWGLNNTGQTGGTPDADIDAPEAWDYAVGSTSVVVGLIDSGVNYTHADLAANIWSNPLEVVNGIDDDGNGFVDDVRGWDFSANDNDPSDGLGHGTHCAGTIAGVGNNGIGVAGVNWHCQILPLKFIDAGGIGYTSDAVEALYYAVQLRQHGVNIRLTSNSWGGGAYSSTLRAAIAANAAADILFVAAAGNASGNNDVTPSYPASYPVSNVIAVAATDHNDTLAWFSNYGAVSVALSAPGVNIYSTVPGGYGTKDGTSMAAPHVSGVAALLAGLTPAADWARIRRAIMQGVDPVSSLTGRTSTGGRLNALKAVRALPWIDHTPPADICVADAAYPVNALIAPASLIDTNTVQVLWNTDGSTSTFSSATFTLLSNDLWRAWIPAQPLGTDIRYWITATTTYGTVLRSPTNAPSALVHVRTVPPVDLTISGTPGNPGSVVPGYGTYAYPSGLVVQAQAAPFSVPETLARWRCTGWLGTGSVPDSNTATLLTFTIDRDSTLEWQWTRQYALQQTSSVPGLLSTTTWWDVSSEAVTLTAPSTLLRQGTNYAFAFWTLDDARQPDATNVAINPLLSVTMTTSHLAQAVYRPETEDRDGDGMADWWELFYFGSTNANPAVDSDSDGFSNGDEYRDRTIPTSSNSIPADPVILHMALADPQAVPAPYRIDTVVTDNASVASVTLAWARNGDTALFTNMAVSGTGGQYQASIPMPGTNGDTFTYAIVASDPAGHVVTNGPHLFHVDYPVLVVTPSAISNILLPFASSTTRSFVVSNAGSTNLAATLDAGQFESVEQGTNHWTHSGTPDLWTLVANRWWSSSHAWYCGNPSTLTYASAMHTYLVSPPLLVAPGAQLTFHHWIKCELDTHEGRAGYAWDGAMVELSTNSGAAFTPIAPVGGYPYLISGWGTTPGESWPEGTPCFAGTGGWQQATFDLSAYAGQGVVLRWHFGSDANTEYEGWYVDDIAVTPSAATAEWLTLGPTNFLVEPTASVTVTVTASSANIPTGDRAALIRIRNNSPTDPEHEMSVLMSVRSPPEVRILSVAQTSTNGQGFITISNAVFDIDGDVCSVEYLWSTDWGAKWQTNWMVSATAMLGVVQCSPQGITQVTALQTLSGTNTITNGLTATWDSSTLIATIALSTDVVVRCRAWDGSFWSSPNTSQNFLIDNVAPSAPFNLTSTSHVLDTWSTNRSVDLTWCPAYDEGIGVSGYRYGVRPDGSALELTAQTPDTGVTIAPVADGTNWQASVQAVDAFGNVGPAATIGRFWIDTTPPSATGAVIVLAHSPYGAYVLGNTVTGTWAGFTDTGSGIAGYYVSFANGAGTTQGQWAVTPPASVNGAPLDATNTVYVWARDVAGMVGPAAAASMVMLGPNGDWDADGLPNAQEEITGTDALDPLSALWLQGLTAPDATGTVFVLQWRAITNRSYSLAYRTGLLPADPGWTAEQDFTGVPGIDGLMSYTGRHAAVTRFYRLSVQQP